MTHSMRREDLTFVGRAPICVEAAVDVTAPPGSVWPAFADAEALPQWFHGVASARYTSPEPHGVGSIRHVSVSGLEVDEEIIAFEPGERFAFSAVAVNRRGFAAIVEVATLEAHEGGTRVTYRQAIELAGWMRPLGSLVRRRFADGLGKGLAGLEAWVLTSSAAVRSPERGEPV